MSNNHENNPEVVETFDDYTGKLVMTHVGSIGIVKARWYSGPIPKTVGLYELEWLKIKESDKNLPYSFYWTEYEVSVMVKRANKYKEDLIKLHK